MTEKGHVLEPEHVLCTDNIQVNINVRLIIARVLTSILAHSRYLTRRVLSTSGSGTESPSGARGSSPTCY
jgi:hypothetical protein